MPRADLHLHSRYSVSSSEYLVRMMRLNESYTSIDTLYTQAKSRGMDYVTVTDHDTIDGGLELVAKYPRDCFVSVEVTARFPEDNCKAHVLVYDISEQQFAHVQAVRNDIYELRDFLVAEQLPHSLAHATYDMDGVLTVSHLEKFILLFNVFEACNGGRDREQNQGWTRILAELTSEKIDDLFRIHRIEPIGPEPWNKGLTGGSDDHAGVFIGTAWTQAPGASMREFIDAVGDRRGIHGGEHGNFRKMALSFYKILYDHTLSRGGRAAAASGIQLFNGVLFGDKGLGFRDRLRLSRARRHHDFGTRMLASLLTDVAQRFGGRQAALIEQDDVEWLYGRLSRHLDSYFSHMLTECGDLGGATQSFDALRKLVSFLPVPLLSMPFLATSKIIFNTSGLVHEARESLYGDDNPLDKPVLWFTDTIVDLNGVTETLKLFTNGAESLGINLALAICVPDQEIPRDIPANTLTIAPVHSIRSEVYSSYTVHFPSLLESLRQVCDYNPREIIVSTPGPMGFIGLMAARILGIPCRSIYHTDFKVQLELIIGQGMAPVIADQFCRAFYAATDQIHIPSRVYMDMLAKRGYPADRLELFVRGLEPEAFGFNPERRFTLMARRDVDPAPFTLFWAGRVSHDKNIEFLLDRYRDVLKRVDKVQLVFAGDGPAFEDYRAMTDEMASVRWLGRLSRAELRDWYSAADLLVFPSAMDTFGMAVLEAQAAGLPAIVTDVGGPQEIVTNGETGYVLSLADPKAWTLHIRTLMYSKLANPAGWNHKRHEIVRSTESRSNLKTALCSLLAIEVAEGPPAWDDTEPRRQVA